MIKNLLLVGLGGGAGSIARYLLQRLSSAIYPSIFPWGTLAVNIIGCFIIGMVWANVFWKENESIKLFLVTGLCGGFTTFSAFTLESIQLIKQDRLALFMAYVFASVLIGLLATYLGINIMRRITD